MNNNSQIGCPYPWLINQWQLLVTRLQQNRLPHALLITGPQGMGKSDFAECFAKLILCRQPSLKTGQSCGECRACQLLQAGNHPDFLLVTTLEESKVIKIDQIRELSEVLSQSAQQGGYKVVIVQNAEKMNTASANALLKTLEEPGPQTLLVLVTAHPALLPATVRSRCQRIPLQTLGFEAREYATQWLEKSLTALGQKTEGDKSKKRGATDSSSPTSSNAKQIFTCTSAQLSLVLNLSDGAPLRAHALIREGLLEKRLQLWEGVNNRGMKTHHPITLANHCLNFEPLDVLEWLTSWLMDMIRSLRTSDYKLVNSDVAIELQQMAQTVSEHRLFQLLDELLNLRHQWLAKINLNYQLMLETIISQWYLLFTANESM